MPSVQNQSAFFLALEEKKRQMTKDISSMANELDMILSKSSKQVNEIPVSCQKPTADLSETIQAISLPSFEPVCPFKMVQSHTGEQEDVSPEAEEPVKAPKKKSEKKVVILSPVQEENSQASIDKKAYKSVFKKCHSDLKKARIGTETKGDFIKSNTVLSETLKNIMIEKYQLA